jgi:hypothetical protein
MLVTEVQNVVHYITMTQLKRDCDRVVTLGLTSSDAASFDAAVAGLAGGLSV